MKSKSNKPRKNKAVILRNADPDLVVAVEQAVLDCIEQGVKISNHEISEITGYSIDTIRVLLPLYTEQKTSRIELRCTFVEKHCWEKKAKKSSRTVSELAATSLSRLTINIYPAETLRAEINKLITLRTNLGNNLNQLARWCNSQQNRSDQITAYTQLRRLAWTVEQQDLEIEKVLTSMRRLIQLSAQGHKPEPETSDIDIEDEELFEIAPTLQEWEE